MARQCIWTCGRKADSKVEDVLAMWIREQLGDVAEQKQWAVVGLVASKLTLLSRAEPLVTPMPLLTRSIYMRARWKVCKPCNNEWMSQLQQRTKEVIGPAIDSQPFTVSPTQQGVVANWATMTAIMADYAHRLTVEEFRRKYFYEHQEPPPNTLVLLANLENDIATNPPNELSTAYFNPRSRSTQNTEDVHLYTCLFSVRRLGFLVLQGATSPAQRRVLAASQARFTQVWPLTLATLRWPPDPIRVSEAMDLLMEVLAA